MIFNEHSKLQGMHAFLGASKYHWVNYDEHKLDATFRLSMEAQRGVELHAYASTAIRLKQKQPRSRKTIPMYVNDCIGWGMRPEQVLFYSENAFGTADAIGFRKMTLRVSDLKTGVTPTKMTQLEIYAALFCLEYDYKPEDIAIELRIYQNDEIRESFPEPERIRHIMNLIVNYDRRIRKLREELS